MKKNATTAGRGHGTRNVFVLIEIERADAPEWKENRWCDKRQIIEIIFSAFKHLFRSDVQALKWENIVQEIKGVGLHQNLKMCMRAGVKHTWKSVHGNAGRAHFKF